MHLNLRFHPSCLGAGSSFQVKCDTACKFASLLHPAVKMICASELGDVAESLGIANTAESLEIAYDPTAQSLSAEELKGLIYTQVLQQMQLHDH